MVIISRANVFPVPDKAGDVRSIIEEFVRTNPNNIRISLWQFVHGELPAFQVVSIFESLDEFEKNRDANFANQNYVQAVARVNSMVRQPNIMRIGVSIVDPVGHLGPQHRYTQQAIVLPTNAGQDEVMGTVESFAKGQQSDGRSLFRVTQAILGHDGPAFSLMDSYETLAELENAMNQRAQKAAQLRSQLASNLRAPVMHRLREVIVPLSQ